MDAEKILNNVKHLISCRSFGSAESILSFFVSTNASGKANYETAVELLGDIAFEKREFRKSSILYEQAINSKKGSTNFGELANLRYKEALCYIERGDFTTAIKSLECIPPALRSEKIQTCFAELYTGVNLRRTSISAHKSAFSSYPWNLDSLRALVDLGVDVQELQKTVDNACKGDNSIKDCFGNAWLKKYVNILILKREGDYTKFVEAASELPASSSNSHLQCLLGMASTDTERFDEAIVYFKQARRINPSLIESMEYYAFALLKKNEEAELNVLAHTVLNCSDSRPEGWLVVALLCQAKSEWSKAAFFVDKALKLHPQCAAAYKLKGQLFYSQEQYDVALQAYIAAHNITKDFPSYLGIINSHFQLGEYPSALRVANEASRSFTRSAEVQVVLGKILCKDINKGISDKIKLTEAEAALLNALQLDPNNQEAANLYAGVLTLNGKPEEAIRLLRRLLNAKSSVNLRVQMAGILASVRQYEEAIEQLQLAISLATKEGSDTTLATQQLEKVENLMKEDVRDDSVANDNDHRLHAAVCSPGDDSQGDYVQDEDEGEDYFDDVISVSSADMAAITYAVMDSPHSFDSSER